MFEILVKYRWVIPLKKRRHKNTSKNFAKNNHCFALCVQGFLIFTTVNAQGGQVPFTLELSMKLSKSQVSCDDKGWRHPRLASQPNQVWRNYVFKIAKNCAKSVLPNCKIIFIFLKRFEIGQTLDIIGVQDVFCRIFFIFLQAKMAEYTPLSFSNRFSSLTPYFIARLSLYLFLLASFSKFPPKINSFVKQPKSPDTCAKKAIK